MTDQSAYDNKSVKHDAKQLADNVQDTVQSKAQDLAENVQTRASEFGHKAADVGQRALDTTRENLGKAGECVKDGTTKTLSYVRQNPGKAIGIAALVGGAVALCLKGKQHHQNRKSHSISGAEKAALVAAALPILKKFAPTLVDKSHKN